MNIRKEFWCDWCQDNGWIELFHLSTNALIGHLPCKNPFCKYVRVWKPSRGDEWKMTAKEYSNWLAVQPPF